MRLPDDPEVRAALMFAMRRLVGRERFSGELEAELRSRGHSDDVATRAVEFLRESGLLDDRRAAESFLQSRSGRRSIGRQKLHAELLHRGSAELAAEEAIAGIDDTAEVSAMREALDSKAWRPGDRIRAARFLHSRGFDPELIESALDSRFGEAAD